jgi:hypothetical protein
MRLLGLLLFLVSLAGLYLFVTGFAATGQIVTSDFDKIDWLASFKDFGRHCPADVGLFMASLFVLLIGLKWMLVGRARPPVMPPAPDPNDEKAVRKYEIQVAAIRPIPRMPTTLLMNSYLILSLVVALFFGSKHGTNPFVMGLMGVVLGLAIFMGLVMMFLAKKVEKSLGSAGGLVSMLVHFGALGVIAAAVVLTVMS